MKITFISNDLSLGAKTITDKGRMIKFCIEFKFSHRFAEIEGMSPPESRATFLDWGGS